MNEIDATASTTSAAAKFACERQVEEQRDDAEQQNGADDAVDDREHAHAEQVHRPRERRHERVLDRPLPALPGDGLGQDLEDDPEVGPDDGADRAAIVVTSLTSICAAGRLDALRDEDDRQRVRDRPEEERDVPPDVALDEVDVALDDAAEADQLVAESCRCARHRAPPRPLRVSLVLERLPVAAKNASSSVVGAVAPLAARRPARATSSSPRSRIPTRSASASASARSCVQSRIVASCVGRISRMNSCTSSFERGSRPVVGSSSRSRTG